MKKSQEGTKDCQREPPNMLQVSLLVRYPNHKFSNYDLTDLNKIILIVRNVIDVNFGHLCFVYTQQMMMMMSTNKAPLQRTKHFQKVK